jgi:hypothetical protein
VKVGLDLMGAIIDRMPLSSTQRHQLLLADRSHDTAAIAAAIEVALRDNPNASLLEIEMAFRDSASTTYLVLTTERLEIVFGMPALLAALAAAGMSRKKTGQR